MRHPSPRSCLLLGLAVSALACLSARSADKKPAKFTAEQVAFYEKQVLPILKENCYKCHAAESKKVRGDFRLDTRALLLKGGEIGPAIDLAKPAQSELVKSLHFTEDPKMPPGRQAARRQDRRPHALGRDGLRRTRPATRRWSRPPSGTRWRSPTRTASGGRIGRSAGPSCRR